MDESVRTVWLGRSWQVQRPGFGRFGGLDIPTAAEGYVRNVSGLEHTVTVLVPATNFVLDVLLYKRAQPHRWGEGQKDSQFRNLDSETISRRKRCLDGSQESQWKGERSYRKPRRDERAHGQSYLRENPIQNSLRREEGKAWNYDRREQKSEDEVIGHRRR